MVRRLVVGGASVQSRDRYGNTPLHLACRDGHVDCVKALCMPVSQEERQAALLHHDIPPQPLPQDLEQRNYDGKNRPFSRHPLADYIRYLCWKNRIDERSLSGNISRMSFER